jgi:hypothetical protein
VSELAHRVPRPLKERAGALWPPRNLRADDQVWRNLGEFEVSWRTTTDGTLINTNRTLMWQQAALWGTGRRGRMPRLRRMILAREMIKYGEMPGIVTCGARYAALRAELPRLRVGLSTNATSRLKTCSTFPPLPPYEGGDVRKRRGRRRNCAQMIKYGEIPVNCDRWGRGSA